jgi:hypothetical protein
MADTQDEVANLILEQLREFRKDSASSGPTLKVRNCRSFAPKFMTFTPWFGTGFRLFIATLEEQTGKRVKFTTQPGTA